MIAGLFQKIDNHQIIWVILNYEFNEARPTIGQSNEDEKSEDIT